MSEYLYDVPGEAAQVHLGGLGGGAAAAPLPVAVSVVLLHRLGSEEDNETTTTLFIQGGLSLLLHKCCDEFFSKDQLFSLL